MIKLYRRESNGLYVIIEWHQGSWHNRGEYADESEARERLKVVQYNANKRAETQALKDMGVIRRKSIYGGYYYE